MLHSFYACLMVQVESYHISILKDNTSLKPAENLTVSLIIHYVNFCAINFPCFLLYSFPNLHVIESYVETDV
jgi:hypothetical protein